MRVKRLEIQGFKSFKDKTVIHFDHGITGIVGPNGCGKSNIVDAFFWVMGEQSYKHMRGNSSEDLIFNGSSRYSPLGIAEATLVMETDAVEESNTPLSGPDAPAGATVKDIPIHLRAKEISVTRRLYRSGEGEYFINGLPARLKDIQELFMDTGVGAKGYSVIEQGQIGKIVNAKPEDRRLLIEEAAGIAKYKARKKESLRKMEAAEANLSRLSDVIAEIDRSLGSLERQAQKARQYKKYKDELLDKEMTWGRRKALVLRQKLDALKKDREALEQELVGLRAELQTAENSIESDRIAQVIDSKQAEELQARIQHFSDELATERSALDLSKQRQEDLAHQLQALEQEKQELHAGIEREKERQSQRETEAQQANSDFETAARKAQTMDERVRKIRQEAEAERRALEQARKILFQGISEASSLTSRAASIMSRSESLQEQLGKLKAQAQAIEAKAHASGEELAQAQARVEAVAAELAEEQIARATLQQQASAQQQEMREASKAREQASQSLTQVRSRLQSLEELAALYEGFGEGPKAALDWARSHGSSDKLLALADVVETAPEYEAALEGWLDSRVESLIAQDASTACSALEQILSGKQGRVEIHLHLDNALSQGTTFSSVRSTLEEAGFIVSGELSQLVKKDPRFSGVANRLTSQVAVVESLKPLEKFVDSPDFPQIQSWSLVALDGSVFDSQGSLRVRASSSDQSASLVRRKRVISELQTQVQAAEADFESAQRALNEAQKRAEGLTEKLQGTQAAIQDLQVRKAALDRDIHQANRAVKETSEQIEENTLEIETTQGDLEKGRTDRESIEAQVNRIVSERAELEARIAREDTEVVAKDIEVRAQEAELQSIRVTEASLRERTSSLKRELENGRAIIADREKRVADIARTLQRATQERQQYTGGESELESRIQGLTQELSVARQELSAVKDRLEQSSAHLNSSLERIKELHKVGDQKSADTNHLALESEKTSSDLSHLIQNLEEKYGPGCLERPVTSPIQEEMSEPIITAEMTADEELLLGEEVERLRERIRRLGEVNVMAIEEYEELKKRSDHLLTEKQDLESSIGNLKEAIEHINKTSEERFKKAFEAIADRFQRLFPIVFGGGQARLSLVYPEGSTDILEAGVDILAQPPGKKIVNIGLLSGGEKALTAVSLIFAIFMVKPSPFCVLDEVDAPLDDANIGKFNALLREMSAKSQFILITHNKKTMELNDTLYGVTMEEPGVSKMVSIELR